MKRLTNDRNPTNVRLYLILAEKSGAYHMYIKRHIENVITECLGEFPVVLISGPRWVGKTTMLKKVCHTYNYCTFDDLLILKQAIEETNLFLMNNEPPLLIDEVQYAPEIFRYIKMRVDRNREKGAFVLTGSQAFPFMKGVSETLAGRMAIIDMQGFSLREIFQVSCDVEFLPTQNYLEMRKKCIQPYHDLWGVMQRGTMPELFDSNINWERYYSSYVKTYIEKDVRQLVNITDEMKFMKFLISLAARCGELLNYNAIANEIEVSIETVKRWILILQTSGIIYLLEPYSNNILKRIVKTPKVYFYDTGLVCYLTRWTTPDVLKNGAKAGNIFENFIVSEILKTYLNAGKTISSIYFYRDKDKKEIDLVIEMDGTLYPIEIKMTGNPTKAMAKHFAVLDAIPDKQRGMGCIICQYDKLLYVSENVVALPVDYI